MPLDGKLRMYICFSMPSLFLVVVVRLKMQSKPLSGALALNLLTFRSRFVFTHNDR